VNADGAGQFVFADVPAGAVRVAAQDPNAFNRAGLATGTVTAGSTATIDVSIGNAFRFGRLNLDGADGFRYDIGCDGSLGDGGNLDRSMNDAYDGAYYLTDTTFNAYYACVTAGLLDQNGRQVVIGPSPFLGMNVTRKIFSPAEGGFARYLEIVENPANTTQTVTVRVSSNLGSDGSTRLVVAPSNTGLHYAVTDQNGLCCDPALAHVFGGPAAPTSVSDVKFADANDDIFYQWTVDVPANGTVILMHFAVQRGITDAAGAEAQAVALVDLSDPKALVGMTDAERSRVVNFNVPPQ